MGCVCAYWGLRSKRLTFSRGGAIFKTQGEQYLSDHTMIFMLFTMKKHQWIQMNTWYACRSTHVQATVFSLSWVSLADILQITRAVKKELYAMKQLNHDNINRFIGACIEAGHISFVTQYCSRGSLKVCLFATHFKHAPTLQVLRRKQFQTSSLTKACSIIRRFPTI